MAKGGNSNSGSLFPNIGFGSGGIVPGQGMQGGPGMATPGAQTTQIMPNVGHVQFGMGQIPQQAQPQENPANAAYGFGPNQQRPDMATIQNAWQNRPEDGGNVASPTPTPASVFGNGGQQQGGFSFGGQGGLFGNAPTMQGLFGGMPNGLSAFLGRIPQVQTPMGMNPLPSISGLLGF